MRARAVERGFASLEVLAAATVVAITLLSIATMYLTAHASLKRSGEATVGTALATQILEEMRSVPFASLAALDGLDTDNSGTLPADDPERDIARRWRYAVAGEGGGWSYTTEEKTRWPTFAPRGGSSRGRLQVTSPSTSVRAVTVTMTVPGRADDLRVATLISRTDP